MATKPSCDADWRRQATFGDEGADDSGTGAGATASRRGWLTRRRVLIAVVQLVVLAISVGVIVGLLHKVNPAMVIQKSGHVAWSRVWLAIALNIPITALRAWRSQFLVDRLGYRVPWRRMAGTQLAGQTLSWLTPAAAGDMVRPYMWRNRDSVPVSAGVAAVLYERLVTLFQLGVIGALLATGVLLPAAAVVGLSAVAVGLLLAPWWLSVLTRRAHRTEFADGRGGIVAGALRALVRLQDLGVSLRVASVFTALTMGVFVLSGVQIVLLAWGVGAGLALWVAISAYCLSQVAGSVSTLPFGLGATDVVVISLLTAAGVGAVSAAAITILLRLATTLPLGIAGALGILVLGRPRIPAEAQT